MRRTWLVATLLPTTLALAGCQTPPPDLGVADAAPLALDKPQAAPAPMAACRQDSAGIVITTDRGIGGTGIGGAEQFANGIGGTGISGSGIGGAEVADRGIGGTGVDGAGLGVAGGIGGTGIDGIGGTGIAGGGFNLALRGRTPSQRVDSGAGVVGVVTGFRSLCVNGLEVGLQGLARLNQDGVPLQTTRLRLGEIAAIDTRGSGAAMHAVGIGIRHEVSGPVTAVVRAGQELEIAGQRVLLDEATHGVAALGGEGPRAGDWIAVSGLRDLDGAIHATRLDARDPGDVLVAGRPEPRGGEWALGRLRLRFAGRLPQPGQRVLLGGRMSGGVLEVDRVAEDRLVAGGGGARHLIVEGYTQAIGRELLLGQGLRAAIGPRFGAPPPMDRPAIIDLVADSANNMVAVSWSLPATPGGALPGSPARSE